MINLMNMIMKFSKLTKESIFLLTLSLSSSLEEFFLAELDASPSLNKSSASLSNQCTEPCGGGDLLFITFAGLDVSDVGVC